MKINIFFKQPNEENNLSGREKQTHSHSTYQWENLCSKFTNPTQH